MIRRLPIICLEDGALHPAFPVLVWCMIASSKGYLLPDFLLSVCVHIIAEISDARHMDSLSVDMECKHPSSFIDEMQAIPTSAATQLSPSGAEVSASPFSSSKYDIRHQPSSSARTLVLSIMLRAAFGGMAGDMKMLREYTVLWYNRLFLVAENITKAEGNSSSSLPIWRPTSMANFLSSPPLSGNGKASASHVQCGSSVSMSSYLHPQWMSSAMGSDWGRHCVLAFATSSPEDGAAETTSFAASNANIAVSAFLLLQTYISQSLLDGHDSRLALYSPARHPGRLPASREGKYSALLLRPADLISEGIDFHCDGEIVRAAFDRCLSFFLIAGNAGRSTCSPPYSSISENTKINYAVTLGAVLKSSHS